MGGPARYFGRDVEKPRLGPAGADWTPARQARLRRLVLWSGMAVVVVVLTVRMLAGYFFENG